MYIGKKPAVTALTASDITDGIVSNAKLAQDIISGDTALAVAPADTDELLISDAGTLKRVDYSYLKSANTPAFYGELASTQTISRNSYVKVTGMTNDEVDSDTAFDGTTFGWSPASVNIECDLFKGCKCSLL